jgi:ribosomal protein S12
MLTSDKEMLHSGKEPKFAEIIAAQKIIADISSGLYRSPAAALKELVSNAYDADATEVRIDTDVPNFRTLVIRDNGCGMSAKQFIYVMNHIGGSRKRIGGNEVTAKGRQTIGRIGIGLLAVAQLGYRFYVTSSKMNSSTRFIAEVDLTPFHRDDAALISMGKMSNEKDEVTIGAIRYVDDIPEDPNVQYTAITVPNVKQGLISEITHDVRKAVGAEEVLSIHKEIIKDFREIIEISRSAKRVDTQFDGYYYMLWELAQICPINYSKFGPIERLSRNIEGYDSIKLPIVEDFKLYVDGIELLRPQLFPSTAALKYSSFDPKAYPISFNKEVSGRRLKFVGYIYAQKPRVDPEELRGVHIRIKFVGIGKYDRTWLGYPFDEGIKFGQITGEIFIEDGLEDALNIDRDSFRETDVHYQALRGYIWDKLRSEVFPDFKRRQKEFTEERKLKERSELEYLLDDAVSQLPTPIHFEEVREENVIGNPTISNWIEINEKSIIFLKEKWNQFKSDSRLTSKDAQERFIRVIKVLVSNEYLTSMPEEEIEIILYGLAIAVQ